MREAPELVGVLEIGGTHVTSALVDQRAARLVPGSVRRSPIDPHAPADELLQAFASPVADARVAPEVPWVVAIPGPFDYRRGIGLYADVGKFDALLNVNLTDRLHAALPRLSGDITFVNDADAFAVGEWRQGVTVAVARCVGITLGSGVGSSFLDNGTPVTNGPTVPPDGRAHQLKAGAADLEDVVSRRAILACYLAGPGVTSAPGLDVHDVFARSRGGDDWATQVLEDTFRALGSALAPWFTRFHATAVAFGGAMTGSWDLILPPLRQGLLAAGARTDIELVPSADTELSALIGAATFAHPV
jgi:glucokinase